MNLVLTTMTAAATLFAAAPAWACMPMMPHGASEIERARAVFVARVTETERLPSAPCERDLRRAGIENGMPGSRSCEAYGKATLESISVAKGEELVETPVVVDWNSQPLCDVGWTPVVGDVVVVLIGDGVTQRPSAEVRAILQSTPEFEALIAQATAAQP
jgi:hypothetical protein